MITRYEAVAGEKATMVASNITNTRKFEIKTPDVVIHVEPDKVELVETRIIDGREVSGDSYGRRRDQRNPCADGQGRAVRNPRKSLSNILGCDKIFLPNMKYKRLVVKEIVVNNSFKTGRMQFLASCILPVFAWMRVS